MNSPINPLFLTTRETFPGEKSFAELSRQFFGHEKTEKRADFISQHWRGDGLLVHMANPEQIDDLFSHIDREEQVRFLSTSFIHHDIQPTVYAIGRGTGILLDGDKVEVDHVSVTDSKTVTAPGQKLVVSDHAKLETVAELHAALKGNQKKEWNEVNVSFKGPEPIVGIFSLDGIMSKLYATVMHLKSEKLLPIFAYRRGENNLFEFTPTQENISATIEEIPVPFLRDRYRQLIEYLK